MNPAIVVARRRNCSIGANGFYDSKESGAMPERIRRGEKDWLVLVYRLPTEPTRLRAKVLRRLHRLGAAPLQRSVVTLPDTSSNERALRIAKNEIEVLGGAGFLFRGTALGCHNQLVALLATRPDARKVSDANG